MRRILAIVLCLTGSLLAGQTISSGTVQGTITDPSSALVAGAEVQLTNSATGFQRMVTTDNSGTYRFGNVPMNEYQLTVTAMGFAPDTEHVDVRSTLPITLNVALKVATETTSVTVEASGAQVETDTSTHQDVDRSMFLKLPTSNPGGALNQAITYSTGAVAADANGLFHPVGDHADTSYVIDGQPITDQQSKTFSTQIPLNALQNMQLITGAVNAEYGDKTSLVVDATTRSGLGATKAFGNIESSWGSFGTWSQDATFGFGSPTFGNFIALNGIRSGRFLDSPESLPFHDVGNNESIFDRVDWQPTPVDAIHVDLFAVRNWFQVPNSLDQLSQDQKQRVLTWNIAPGYQHTFGGHTLLTINPYVRRDQLNYYASRNPFADTPASTSQNRFLTNYGIKADLARTQGRHNLKAGVQIQQWRLDENFAFGITDPAFNPVCLNAAGNPLPLPGVTNPNACSGVNPSNTANPDFLPGILPYDLTRGGSRFSFHGRHNINEYSFYITDEIRMGDFTLNAGLREDQYNGLSSANGIQPRLGVSYQLLPKTVIRASYARTFETPYNENLVLSSGTGGGGLTENVFGSQPVPLKPGNRNEFDAGLQQGIKNWIVVDGDYFWKYTHNAFDFSVFFNTPITFPIAWHNSKVDGVTARVSTTNLHGFQAYLTLGHTRARYFPPEVGGLIPLGGFSNSVFRIDHDQAYQQNAVFRYQRPKNTEWIDFTWRYDSGMVVSGVPDVASVLALTASQQVAIGFSCNGLFATYSAPITACSGVGKSTLLTLPQTGTESNDHNPDRVRPRNLFNFGVGTDNLLHSEKGGRITLRFTVENLTNKVALYNFLSTFSGTHFVAPRTFEAGVGYSF